MSVLTSDQLAVLDYLAAEQAGWGVKPMPFKLARFKGIRDNLVRLGYARKTDTGRFVPTRTSLCAPDKPQGQSERTPEGIA